MESLPRFVIVAVLAILFGQSCCFGTDVRNEILKAYDKVKDSFTGSGKSENLMLHSIQTAEFSDWIHDFSLLIIILQYLLKPKNALIF
jgi:hypothetical protein